MSKKKINEVSIGKFIDAFFTNLAKNTEARMINQAEQKNLNSDVVNTMREISKLSAELKEKLKKYK